MNVPKIFFLLSCFLRSCFDIWIFNLIRKEMHWMDVIYTVNLPSLSIFGFFAVRLWSLVEFLLFLAFQNMVKLNHFLSPSSALGEMLRNTLLPGRTYFGGDSESVLPNDARRGIWAQLVIGHTNSRNCGPASHWNAAKEPLHLLYK